MSSKVGFCMAITKRGYDIGDKCAILQIFIKITVFSFKLCRQKVEKKQIFLEIRHQEVNILDILT